MTDLMKVEVEERVSCYVYTPSIVCDGSLADNYDKNTAYVIEHTAAKVMAKSRLRSLLEVP